MHLNVIGRRTSTEWMLYTRSTQLHSIQGMLPLFILPRLFWFYKNSYAARSLTTAASEHLPQEAVTDLLVFGTVKIKKDSTNSASILTVLPIFTRL